MCALSGAVVLTGLPGGNQGGERPFQLAGFGCPVERVGRYWGEAGKGMMEEGQEALA